MTNVELNETESCATIKEVIIRNNGLSAKANAFLADHFQKENGDPTDDCSFAEDILFDFESFRSPHLPQSNTEFVVDVMNYSNSGAMIQMFVIEALRYYSEQVAKGVAPENDPNAFINPRSWWHCAKELQKKIRAKYEGDVEDIQEMPATLTVEEDISEGGNLD
jgi:hypothetical protein